MKRRTKKKFTFPSCLDLSGVCEREIEIERERKDEINLCKKKKKRVCAVMTKARPGCQIQV